MQLLDKYLPAFTYNEYHSKLIKASTKECFEIAKNLDMSRSFITRTLMRLRGLPARDLTLQGFIKNICFNYVEEDLYKEFVIDASQRNIKIFSHVERKSSQHKILPIFSSTNYIIFYPAEEGNREVCCKK